MTPPLQRYTVYGFASVHEALAAESILKADGVGVTVVPSPRELGELCGIALRVEPELEPRVERLLAEAGHDVRAKASIDDI